jgi:hypothetical protein
MTHRLGWLLAAASLMAFPLSAQNATQSEPRPVPLSVPLSVPFGVGERAEYQVKFSKITAGSATMEVVQTDTLRGQQVWHTLFNVRGGIPFYRVNDTYESWFDIYTLASLRYRQDINEGNYKPKRLYEIYPERLEYVENDKEPQPSVEHPLDEGAFLYFIRTLPLHVGMDTSFNSYFKAKANPIRIRVVRADTIDVPAGRFAALVVQPRFDSKLFSEGGHAEVWLSDDENRIVLQMKSKVSFGSLNLSLKSFQPSPGKTAPVSLKRNH